MEKCIVDELVFYKIKTREEFNSLKKSEKLKGRFKKSGWYFIKNNYIYHIKDDNN